MITALNTRQSWELTASQYLDLLFGGCPGYVNIWTAPNRHSHWHTTNDLNRAENDAIRFSDTQDVYVVMSTQKQIPSSGRGTEENAAAISCVWADIDIKGPTHKQQDLPTTEGDVQRLLDEFGLEPTLVVVTGGGLHVYWMFYQPWVFNGADEWKQARSLTNRVQGTIKMWAKQHGWKIDSTSDLVRVLRVPDTYNRKKELALPYKVHVIDYNPTNLYNPGDFESYLINAEPDEVGHDTTVTGKIGQGARNSSLFSFDCSLRAKYGLTEDEIYQCSSAVNLARCEPPLDDDELRHIAHSAARYEAGEFNPPRVLNKAERELSRYQIHNFAEIFETPEPMVFAINGLKLPHRSMLSLGMGAWVKRTSNLI